MQASTNFSDTSILKLLTRKSLTLIHCLEPIPNLESISVPTLFAYIKEPFHLFQQIYINTVKNQTQVQASAYTIS